MTLKYAKRSKLNKVVECIKSASKLEIDDFVFICLKPLVEESRFPDLVQHIHSIRDGLCDDWNAGTHLACFLDYDVISEDAL